MRDFRVKSGEIELAVRERGEGNRPTVVLVHGYPDTGAVWDEVADRLASRFRVVTYDVRGAGASSAPRDPLDYGLDALVGDLGAVLDGAGADEPVHLVGHDWGSVLGWEAVIGDRLRGRIASYTSISGPDRRHMARWVHRSLRSGPRGVAEVAGQARRSVYMPVLRAPRVGELMARGLAAAFARGMRRREGAEPRPGHPADTLPRDAVNGLGLYRVNLGRGSKAGADGDGSTDVPVQLIVPTKDRYGSPSLLLSARGPVARLYVRRAPAGHWVARSHPDLVARWVAEFAEHIGGGPETPALAAARAAGEPGLEFGGDLVVVTGAGHGIGRATARAFAAEGARVVVADIDEVAARRTADEIGDRAHSYRVDVADASAMEDFAAHVRDVHGVPDVVVNNAGIAMAGSLLETSEDDWARVRSVNLDGVYRGCRLFGRQMVERGEGCHLVNVASMSAFGPSADTPAYSATKAAVLHLGGCLRSDLERHGIGVSTVCPGVIDTGLIGRTDFVGLPPGAAAAVRERMAGAFERRGHPPEKVASAILRAVRRDAPVVPVGVEAHAAGVLARVSPSATRALARVGRRAGDRLRAELHPR
ncbi:SDR family oxidoreductase [Actinomadura litoris]|uniref:SDR family oxidoreductase n=1 Tax=Actinomadura litoris TaxID=2678616 RepID=UPI001FA71F0A|nr:SDR family oxidoreductase [Actinomadura litoris]